MLTPIAIKLHPEQDLKVELDRLAHHQCITGASILTCSGSLKAATLRYGNPSLPIKLKGPFKIISLTGSLSKLGSSYHITIADDKGQTTEAQLLEGSLSTTTELVIGILGKVNFLRTLDPQTGYDEMKMVAQLTLELEKIKWP